MLKIDDKDYSITFSLYFNVQWSEPRLNLSQEFFNSENITGDEQLVPGKYQGHISVLDKVFAGKAPTVFVMGPLLKIFTRKLKCGGFVTCTHGLIKLFTLF